MSSSLDAAVRDSAVRGLREYIDAHLSEKFRACAATGRCFADCLRGLHAWTDADFETAALELAPQLSLDLQQAFFAWAHARGQRCTEMPAARALLQPFLLAFVSEPFVTSGAYFAATTPPLVKKDCIADALVTACVQCERDGHHTIYAAPDPVRQLLTTPVQTVKSPVPTTAHAWNDELLFPNDSVSNVGSPAPSPRSRVERARSTVSGASTRVPEVVLADSPAASPA